MARIIENQMEKKVEHSMQAGHMQWFIETGVCQYFMIILIHSQNPEKQLRVQESRYMIIACWTPR